MHALEYLKSLLNYEDYDRPECGIFCFNCGAPKNLKKHKCELTEAIKELKHILKKTEAIKEFKQIFKETENAE